MSTFVLSPPPPPEDDVNQLRDGIDMLAKGLIVPEEGDEVETTGLEHALLSASEDLLLVPNPKVT